MSQPSELNPPEGNESQEPELPRDLEDRIFRESLAEPANLRAFLRQVVPELADDFVYDQAQVLSREYFTPTWQSREADLPVQLPIRVGDHEELAVVLVLIEHQAQPNSSVPLRVLYFAVTYWMKQFREWETSPSPRPAFRLGAVLPIVLHTGAQAWTGVSNLRELYGGPEALRTYVPDWGPLLWNLSEHDAQQLSATGEGWLQLLALARVWRAPQEDFLALFTQTQTQLANLAPSDPTRWRTLLEMTWRYALHRRPTQEREALRAAVQAAYPMNQTQGEQLMQTIADALRQEGRDQGRDQGRVLGTRESLRELLEARFGELPEAVLQRIEATSDLQRLRAATVQVLHMQSLDELNL